MRLQRQATREVIQLSDEFQLGVGGEARIFVVPQDPSRVLKIWHKPTTERARKVRAMLANPPTDPMAGQGHVAIAWPLELVSTFSPKPAEIGFIMPRVLEMHPIIDFFNPKTRLQRSPLFNYFYLVRTARNLATAIRALHERGYVVGDLNECNILASETALVTLVDTDSFQVWDAEQGVLYRCRVGRPEFTPPELQGKSFAQVNREPAHDLFGLGIVLFQLLMEGTHPFAGAYHGRGEPPPYPERIRAGQFPHAQDARVAYSPMPTAPRFQWLHPVAQHLFMRCFWEGHANPALRPDTLSWQYGMEEVEQNLVSCPANAQHVFSNHLPSCPWCERAAMLGGRDPFPSLAAVQAGDHLQPLPPRSSDPSAWTGPPSAWGSGPLSNPPMPPPISTPSARTRRRRRPVPRHRVTSVQAAFGASRRNEWAWMGLGVGVLAVLLAFWPAAAGLGGLLSMAALILGLAGEVKARDWYCDGRGLWPARTAMALGVISLLLQPLLRAATGM